MNNYCTTIVPKDGQAEDYLNKPVWTGMNLEPGENKREIGKIVGVEELDEGFKLTIQLEVPAGLRFFCYEPTEQVSFSITGKGSESE